MENDDPSDLFAVPDFWRSSTWLNQTIGDINRQNPLFTFNESDLSGLKPTEAPRSPPRGVDDEGHGFFKLPSLLKELVGPEAILQPQPRVDDFEAEPEPEHEAAPEPEPSLDGDDDDFWFAPRHDDGSGKLPEYKTWESFDQDEQAEQVSRSSLFITEVGPAAFDALLAAKQPPGDRVPDLLDAASYCASLLSLALGRSSILFSWDTEKNSFVKTAPYLRISGLSLGAVKAVDRLCLDCGNAARHLQTFADATYSTASTPTRVALAGVVDRLVQVVRSELSARSRDVRSILQLQYVVQPVQSALLYFKRLVKKLAQQKSDEGLLSCLFQETQACEYRDRLLRAVTREVLRILSKPLTDSIEEWVGLKLEDGIPMSKQGPAKGFVKVADKMWIDDQGFELEEPDYFLDENRMPTFIPEDMAQTIFETGRNLRFIREHHPEHPLSRPDIFSMTMPPSLEWEFDWGSISKLEQRVNQYRNAVSSAIQGIQPETQQGTMSRSCDDPKTDAVELACFGRSEAQVEADILASLRQLDQPLDNRVPQDELAVILREQLYQTAHVTLDPTNLSPHWALIPLLSFSPVIEAQSSVINQECMKLLFNSHHLRTHIDLLKQYFLLGNGLLCSRLSHALFDPNLETAERKSGVALLGGTMGLRLGGRQTWPPASSELRLALMGVLADCYDSPLHPNPSSPATRGTKSTLPGELSFAVRDLSPEEIDRCMDPDSLEALDFLRLSYRPPAPLRPVLAPTVLLKYDRVFKLLLRVLRMLFVANELFLDSRGFEKWEGGGEESNASRRFRYEARHFIRQVASYFFDVGVAAPWRGFESWLDGVQADVEAENEKETAAEGLDGGGVSGGRASKVCCSPDALRERQEMVLDEVMGVLLLRKRQAPVLALLEEVFAVVLRFVKRLRLRSQLGGEGVEGLESAEVLYAVFRRKVEVFVTVCRGLGEKTGKGRGEGFGGVQQLVVMLDMGGFYRNVKGGRG